MYMFAMVADTQPLLLRPSGGIVGRNGTGNAFLSPDAIALGIRAKMR